MELAALGRDGLVSAADARRAGITSNRLAAQVRAGEAYPLVRGWYTLAPPTDLTQRHRLMTIAAARHLVGRAVPSHHSALVLHGLPTYRADLDTVHLTRTIPGSSRRRPHAMLHPPVHGVRPGRPVPVAVAVVQAGIVGHPLTALVAADAALHTGLMTTSELTESLSLFTNRKGVGPVRAALAEADARVESPGETLLGFRLRRLGWRVHPQFEVMTDVGRRFADFRIEGTDVLVEFDGAVKYTDQGALFREKQREDALRRAGWVVVRFVWADLDDPELIQRRVLSALATAPDHAPQDRRLGSDALR